LTSGALERSILSKCITTAPQIIEAMAPNTPLKLISVDVSKHPYEQPCLHNRWHPDIPPVRDMFNTVYTCICANRCVCMTHSLAAQVASVKVDQLFRIETVDWTGGQIKVAAGLLSTIVESGIVCKGFLCVL